MKGTSQLNENSGDTPEWMRAERTSGIWPASNQESAMFNREQLRQRNLEHACGEGWRSQLRGKVQVHQNHFDQNHFDQNPLSSKTTFIENQFHQKTTFIKMPLSSKTTFIKNHFHQKTIFIKNQFHQKPLSSEHFLRGTHHPSKNNTVQLYVQLVVCPVPFF